MKAKLAINLFVATLLSTGVAQASSFADVRITEWMYNPVGSSGEFIELTNLGTSAIDFGGWSFDDSTELPGSEDLSAFGSVQAGESVILTESDANVFRTEWNLGATVKVIGGITNNLGRSDEINIYDDNNTLIDRLTYNDQGTGTVKGPRTQGVSGNPGSEAVIGANNASGWVKSALGDSEGSWTSAGGDIGNPGVTSYAASITAPVPEADTYALMLAGLGLVGMMSRRRKS